MKGVASVAQIVATLGAVLETVLIIEEEDVVVATIAPNFRAGGILLRELRMVHQQVPFEAANDDSVRVVTVSQWRIQMIQCDRA